MRWEDVDVPRVVLRPLANPLPLGFIALAVATTTVAAQQLDWVRPTEQHSIALVLLVFVAPAQLVVAVLSSWARDVVASTGMGVLAGTWGSVGIVMLSSAPGTTSKTLGILLVVAALAMAMPAVAALDAKLVPAAVLTITTCRFAVTGVYELTGSSGWKTAAGIVGVALGALALYAALALLLEDARHRTVLPVLRRGSGKAAVTEDQTAQVREIAHEAGVRSQL